MTGQWLLWAQRDPAPVEGREFFHFGAREWVTMCYGGDVVPVRLFEDPDGIYWGWDDARDGLTMVQPHRGMFTMQFPYGPDVEEERGNGRSVQLRVEILDVDLDDTTNCPKASSCFACTEVHDDDQLAVATYTTPVGVVCVTMCDDCVETGPDISGWGGAVEMAMEHCGHLGVDADEMAALMEMERSND